MPVFSSRTLNKIQANTVFTICDSKTTGLFKIPYTIFHVYALNLQTAYLLFANKCSIFISLFKKIEYMIFNILMLADTLRKSRRLEQVAKSQGDDLLVKNICQIS